MSPPCHLTNGVVGRTPFSSRPSPPYWRYAAGFDWWFALLYCLRFLQLLFFAFFLASWPGRSEVWEVVLRSRIFDSWPSKGNRDFPQFQYIFAYAAHLGGLGLWFCLGRPVITSEIANGPFSYLFGFRFVFGIIMK